ncbi:uncharacterized protein LOC123322523 [Coccinella septempunctata]|uniref:uncharacterized protein LOC123322523 n=1 Tax=Coccinella septempunctata TaxID=41139 RepID=UPI001D09197A|nr:uncharacterized protein LOC123322523 [Coccinella septempunctata]
MKPLTLPVPPNEIFHLWTGMVGTGDGRGSGSNGTLSLVMVLPELTQDAGVPVCETSAAVGRLIPSPRSIRDVQLFPVGSGTSQVNWEPPHPRGTVPADWMAVHGCCYYSVSPASPRP